MRKPKRRIPKEEIVTIYAYYRDGRRAGCFQCPPSHELPDQLRTIMLPIDYSGPMPSGIEQAEEMGLGRYIHTFLLDKSQRPFRLLEAENRDHLPASPGRDMLRDRSDFPDVAKRLNDVVQRFSAEELSPGEPDLLAFYVERCIKARRDWSDVLEEFVRFARATHLMDRLGIKRSTPESAIELHRELHKLFEEYQARGGFPPEKTG